ncbi:MAG: hypothetical protein ACRDKG_04325 [Actinomycetota bacterium]
MDQVRLPELETIRRFSIAVRSEHADAEQVIEALRMDLERVEGALKGRRTAATPRRASGARTTSKSTRR